MCTRGRVTYYACGPFLEVDVQCGFDGTATGDDPARLESALDSG